MSLPTRNLGKDGPSVPALGLGLMSLGNAYGPAGSDSERLAFLDKAHELGARHWDGADIYGDTEDLLGKWFKRTGKRNDIFLATKFGFLSDFVSVRSDPEFVRRACERSLEKLGVGCIDLYYCHRVDKETPIERTVEAMAELKRQQGKIKYLGLSEISSQTLRRAHAVHPISAVQVEYSPFALDIENPQIDLLKTCRELGVSIVAYSPLGRGVLTGSIKSRDDIKGDYRASWPRFSEENFHRNLVLVEQIKVIADKRDLTLGQATLAFLLAQGPDIIPIPGTKRVKVLEENLSALKIVLSDEEIGDVRKAAEAAVPAGERYPEVFMDSLFADTPPF